MQMEMGQKFRFGQPNLFFFWSDEELHKIIYKLFQEKLQRMRYTKKKQR